MSLYDESDKFISAINDFQNVPGRLEKIPLSNGVTLFVDYTHMPDGLCIVAIALKKVIQNAFKLITIFWCGGVIKLIMVLLLNIILLIFILAQMISQIIIMGCGDIMEVKYMEIYMLMENGNLCLVIWSIILGETYEDFGDVKGYQYDNFQYVDKGKIYHQTNLFVAQLKNQEFKKKD